MWNGNFTCVIEIHIWVAEVYTWNLTIHMWKFICKNKWHMESSIDLDKKDGSMYILPECIAGIMQKGWKKMPRKAPKNIKRFNKTKKITSSLMVGLQQTSTYFVKRFPTAMYFGKMYVRHLFRYDQFL